MIKKTEKVRGEAGRLSWGRQWLEAGGVLSGSSAQNWALSLADQAVVSLASFCTGVIIGRSCGKDQLGLYVLGMSIINFLLQMQYAFISSPYTVFSPQLGGASRARYTGSTLLHQWIFSATLVIILAVVWIYLSQGRGPQGLDVIVLTLIFMGSFITFREYVRRICFSGLHLKAALFLDAGAALAQVAGLLLLAYLGKLSAARAFGVMGLGCALMGLAWLRWARRSFTISLTEAKADFARNWSFGKWVLSGNLAIFISYQFFPWALTFLDGLAAVGILAACQGVIALSTPFLEGSAIFLEAKSARVFAQGGIGDLRGFVVKSAVIVGAVMALFSLTLLFLGGKLVVFLYGPQYAGQNQLVFLLSLYILLAAIAYVFHFGFRAMDRQFYIIKANLLRLALVLTLGFWLVKVSGPLGVAWGLLAGNLLVAALYCLDFLRISHDGRRQ